MKPLEYTTAEDRFFDYCLYEYQPAVPYAGKFRSVNLLYHSTSGAGVVDRIYPLVQTIRQAIGISSSVWGTKKLGDSYSWEFYFYDYRRRQRERSITRILDAIRPMIRSSLVANENLRYFMFSMDINDDFVSGARDLEELHMYIGNVSSTVQSGICYLLTSSGTKMENFYFFYDPKIHYKELIAKISCSAHIDTTIIDINQILWPELKNCKTICIANKQGNDCIYFSGINVDQFIFFLKRMGYPSETINFVEDNRSKLDHLQYDVGIDYRMEGDALVVLKSGYYGNF